MPKNEIFSFSVFVGEQQLEENIKDSHPSVEADILGPYGRTEITRDEIDGEEELQKSSPILPYQIKVHYFDSGHPSYLPVYAYVSVDGFSVCRLFMYPGQTKTVQGFRDGGDLRELLFSLPSLARNQITNNVGGYDQQRDIGVIEVTIKEAIYKKTVQCSDYRQPKHRKLEFMQATKKDSKSITKGMYLMATTKAGKSLQQKKRKRSMERDIYYGGWELGKLKLHYRIKSTIIKSGGCITIEDDEQDNVPLNEATIEQEVDEDEPILMAVIISVEDDTNERVLITIDDDDDAKIVPPRKQRITTIDNHEVDEDEKKVPSKKEKFILTIDDHDNEKIVPLKKEIIMTIDDHEDEKQVPPRKQIRNNTI